MDDVASPRRPRLLLTLLVVLLAVVLTTNVILLLDRRDAAEVSAVRPVDIGAPGWTESSAGRAVQTARTAARTYFTIDHRTVADDMERMRRLGTPEFVEDYDAAARALGARITAQRLSLAGTLPRDGTATEYLLTNRAVVLVSVDVTTSRDGREGTTRYRTRIALDLVDDQWLVASLDEVT